MMVGILYAWQLNLLLIDHHLGCFSGSLDEGAGGAGGASVLRFV